MKINTLTPEQFLTECENAFSFLYKHGFSKPVLWSVSNLFQVTFYNKNLAIECSYDVRDQMCSTRVLKLSNGEKPECYRVNKKGKVVAGDLIVFLTPEQIKLETQLNKLVKKKKRPTQIESLQYELSGDVSDLKKYGQKILDDRPEIFDNLDPNTGDKF